MSDQLVLAVDGGNSKTYLALSVRRPRARARPRPAELAAPSRPRGLHRRPRAPARGRFEQGRPAAARALAEVGVLLLAGVDFPSEEEELAAALGAAAGRPHDRRQRHLRRAARGHRGGWGVAVVCGAGINCVGVAPDGRQARFPALGAITGDWGGGHDVGLAAVVGGGAQRGRPRARTCLEQLGARRISG